MTNKSITHILDSLFNESDILFRDVFSSQLPFQPLSKQISYPIMDAYYDDEHFYLKFVVNGLKKEDLEISLDDDILEVKYSKPLKTPSFEAGALLKLLESSTLH